MWTSEQGRRAVSQESAADVGAVTLGGDPAGVSVGGERRWLSVYSPGGYCWRPSAGDKVMVIKAGAEGESPCILGTLQNGAQLAPGEVRLSGDGSALYLRQGRLDLEGEVYLNGITLKKTIQKVVSEMLGGGE